MSPLLKHFNMDHEFFSQLFPFYLCLDKSMQLISFGPKLVKACTEIKNGFNINQFFKIIQPESEFSDETIAQQVGDLLILESVENSEFKLKGQVVVSPDQACFLFIGLPFITEIKQLSKCHLVANDFPIYDPTIDLAFLVQMQKKTLAENKQLISDLNQKILETEEAHRQLEASAKLVSIGELAAGVGHEINNPLAVVSGNTSIIRRELSKDQPDLDLISKATERQADAAERIRRIVDGLRVYSRANHGDLVPINVVQLVKGTVSLIESIYEKDGVTIGLTLPEKPVFVKGDMGKFQQVVMNLISNAKDSLELSTDPKITISLEADTHEFRLNISDNGCGIPPELSDKIFDSFFTTKPVGKGTGMGLGISSQIIRSFGGSMDFFSDPGQGTTFTVTLPLTMDRDFELTERMEPVSDDTDNVSQLGQLKVLLVEDEQDVREILLDILDQIGVRHVDVASNGAEGMKKIEQENYQVVFCDMKMPVLDGPGFLNQLKASPMRKPFCIMMSGGVELEPDDQTRFQSSMVGASILKPFDPEKIRDILLQKAKGAHQK